MLQSAQSTEKNNRRPITVVTGDTHGNFARLEGLTRNLSLREEDRIIILGDSGINYAPGESEERKKADLQELGVQIFAILGNHDLRPCHVEGYHLVEYCGGLAWQQDAYDHIHIAGNGEIYHLAGRDYIAIGGAYSVDKPYRLEHGCHWFPDEQLTEEEMNFVWQQLDSRDWTLSGGVLSHTVPINRIPRDSINRHAAVGPVDNRMEYFLQDIHDHPLQFSQWLAGHEHVDERVGRVQILLEQCLFLDGTGETFGPWDELIECEGEWAAVQVNDRDGNLHLRVLSGSHRAELVARTMEEAKEVFSRFLAGQPQG